MFLNAFFTNRFIFFVAATMRFILLAFLHASSARFSCRLFSLYNQEGFVIESRRWQMQHGLGVFIQERAQRRPFSLMENQNYA